MKRCKTCRHFDQGQCAKGVTIEGVDFLSDTFYCAFHRKQSKPKTPRLKGHETKTQLEKDCVKLHSQWIRARDYNRCYFVGKIPHRCTGVMQNNHIISRTNKRLKFDDRNCVCACDGMNYWSKQNEKKLHDYFRANEPERWAYLEPLSRENKKSYPDLRLILLVIKSKLRRVS